MNSVPISINVDADVAQLFTAASEQERHKLELLLNLRLREWLADSARALSEIMDEIGESATAKGLTPELLHSLLEQGRFAE